ncbi:MAG: ComEA family DNA-binding protein, partial [Anaerolineae bacterium]
IGEAAPPVQGDASGGGVAPQGPVNINTADADTLQTLPGIGPALAERIIAYREENGQFGNIQDLQNVSGIGPSTFEQLADLITVGAP